MSQRLLVSTQEPADRALECQWWHMFALCLQSANVTCGCTSFYVAGHKSVQVRLGLEFGDSEKDGYPSHHAVSVLHVLPIWLH